MLIDIYFSRSLHDKQMNNLDWIDEHDEYMPVIKIDDKYVPFSEQIEHGKRPILRQEDLKLIATISEKDINIINVRKYEFFE